MSATWPRVWATWPPRTSSCGWQLRRIRECYPPATCWRRFHGQQLVHNGRSRLDWAFRKMVKWLRLRGVRRVKRDLSWGHRIIETRSCRSPCTHTDQRPPLIIILPPRRRSSRRHMHRSQGVSSAKECGCPRVEINQPASFHFSFGMASTASRSPSMMKRAVSGPQLLISPYCDLRRP